MRRKQWACRLARLPSQADNQGHYERVCFDPDAGERHLWKAGL
jgi:hypothetical protein